MSEPQAPSLIIEHRIRFIGAGPFARLDAIETALAQLIPKVANMATTIETMQSEQVETSEIAQQVLDASTAVAEVVTDLRNTIAEMQANQGNVVSAEQLAAWKQSSDDAQVKMRDTAAKLTAILNPPAPAPAPAP